LLAEDFVDHFQRLQILVDGEEESIITTYHVSDGIDSCCVGSIKVSK